MAKPMIALAMIAVVWLFDDKESVPVVAHGGKVVDGVQQVSLSFDDGTRSGPIPVRGQHFVYVADAKPAGDDGALIGPGVTELVAFDEAGNEIFHHTAEQLK